MLEAELAYREGAHERAFEALEGGVAAADALLVVGSSLQVFSAFRIARAAAHRSRTQQPAVVAQEPHGGRATLGTSSLQRQTSVEH
ncbi:MAG: hypothetical protein VX017_10840, partial [Pseudomonadota bacterium]|nr:hypothetical protein [Pseudomonadota bacterium]